MSPPSVIRELGFRALAGLSRATVHLGLNGRGLRILAYHDVPDASQLFHQLEWVKRRFNVVGVEEVLEGFGRDRHVDGAVLVTFDDGDPTVVDRGRRVLDSLGIEAIMFVCPGIVDTEEPYWWQLVQAAAENSVEVDGRLVSGSDVLRLKNLPDFDRRDFIARLRSRIDQTAPAASKRRQITTGELRAWVDSGHAIGNHTWNHPLLDKCDPADQESQIRRAHDWLLERGLMARPVFAFPNGNISEEADEVLRDLGYVGAMLFDHRIARGSDAMRMSRLRVNVADDTEVFISKLSGLHPLVHAAAGRR